MGIRILGKCVSVAIEEVLDFKSKTTLQKKTFGVGKAYKE